MLSRITYTVMVCLLVLAAGTVERATAYTVDNIYVTSTYSGLFAPAAAQGEPLIPEEPSAGPAPKTEVEPLARTGQPTLVERSPGMAHRVRTYDPIVKVKPIRKVNPYCYGIGRYQDRYQPQWGTFVQPGNSMLPKVSERGWGMAAEAFFARTKGKARYFGNYWYQYQPGWTDSIDFNSDLGLPEHAVIGIYSATYRFRPRWSLKYSFMPLELNGSGNWGGSNYYYGGYGYNNRVKFEQQTHMLSLVYDPISNDRVRVGILGGFVRVDNRLGMYQPAYQASLGGGTLNMDMNMGFAGVEVEKCLKNGGFKQALSLVCKAQVSFGDDAFGSDLSTGLRYSIPMNRGRWGYLAGGYRFLTYKKKLSDIKEIDTAAEGGYLQMGFIF